MVYPDHCVQGHPGSNVHPLSLGCRFGVDSLGAMADKAYVFISARERNLSQ